MGSSYMADNTVAIWDEVCQHLARHISQHYVPWLTGKDGSMHGDARTELTVWPYGMWPVRV